METSSSTSTSTQIFQEILGTFHSRKLLLHNPLAHISPPSAAPLPSTEVITAFEDNIFLILSVSLCGVIGSIGVTFILRCLFRCANVLVSDSNGSNSVDSKLPVNRGIKEKALKTFPVVNYSVEMKEKFPGLDTECAICLSEFESGESLRLLPKCNHGFHVGCIDKWLKSHSSCPKCRQCLIETYKKSTSSGKESSSESVPAVPKSDFIVVIIAPESMMCNREFS